MRDDINQTYVEWANTLDSTGKDSTGAIERLQGDEGMMSFLHNCLSKADTLANDMDVFKKWVFYGKAPKTEQSTDWLSETELRLCRGQIRDHNTIRIIHAIAGLITEIGELAIPLQKHLFKGHVIDFQNMIEEIGDLFWYMALLARANGFGNFVPFMLSNKAKLTKRYRDNWSQDAALNRDVAGEMRALITGVVTTGMTERELDFMTRWHEDSIVFTPNQWVRLGEMIKGWAGDTVTPLRLDKMLDQIVKEDMERDLNDHRVNRTVKQDLETFDERFDDQQTRLG